ncbi:MAG: histidine kinase [Chloroflexota bacterium]|nr:histidine kinase [Chloroflexota bacterium]
MLNWSLRTRFLLFAFACLIPLTAVVGYYLDRSRDRSVEQTIAYQTTLASQTSRSVSSFIDNNVDAMQGLAQLPDIVGLDSEDAGNALGEARTVRQELSGIFLLDTERNVINSSGTDPALLLDSITDQAIATISQGEFTVSQRIPLDSEVNAIVLMVPVTTISTTGTEGTDDEAGTPPEDTPSDEQPTQPIADDEQQSTQLPGQTIGVIGAVLQVERLAQWTLPGSRGQSEIAIVSRGELLYSTSGVNPTGSGFVTDKQMQIELALDGESNQFSYTDPTGTERIAVATPLGYDGVNWVIIVTQPSPSIFQGLSTPEVLFVFALAVIVITAMAVVLGELTARPLRTLAAQAQALHQGRLRGPVVATGSGEIRSLGLHFAEMAHQMNTQVAVLEDGRQDRERQAEQMRDLLRRTNRLQEDERRRIASDIHDAVSPLITGALYQTRALQMTNGSTPDDERDSSLGSISELLERAGEELHDVIFELRPPDLDDLGVVAAIEAYAQTIQRTGLSCRLEMAGEPPSLTPEVRLGIYRIVQESLHNVLRHAGADEAVVRLDTSDELLRVTIRDNGAGFDPAMAVRPTSLGLLSMRERAESIGATFTIVSKPGGGTAIVIERPNSGDVMSDEVLESMMLQSNGRHDSTQESPLNAPASNANETT